MFNNSLSIIKISNNFKYIQQNKRKINKILFALKLYELARILFYSPNFFKMN